jgi:hypothetical protein
MQQQGFWHLIGASSNVRSPTSSHCSDQDASAPRIYYESWYDEEERKNAACLLSSAST